MKVIAITLLVLGCQMLYAQNTNKRRDYHPKWYPDGKNLVFYSYRSDGVGVYSIRVNGENEKKIGMISGSHPIISPDGKHLVLCKKTEEGTRKLHLLDAVSGELVRVIDHGRSDLSAFHPSWTPDGRILFNAEKKGESNIVMVNVDGSGLKTIVEGMNASSPTSYDKGQRVIFNAKNKEEYVSLYTATIQGSDIQKLTNGNSNDLFPEVSPKGDKIVYCNDQTGNLEVYIMSMDGSEKRRLTFNEAGDFFPRWSPDGKSIAFATEMYGNASLALMKIKRKKAPQIIQLTNLN